MFGDVAGQSFGAVDVELFGPAARERGHQRRHREVLLGRRVAHHRLGPAHRSRAIAALDGANEINHRGRRPGRAQQSDGAFADDFSAIDEQQRHQFADHRQRRHRVTQLFERSGALIVGARAQQALNRGA